MKKYLRLIVLAAVLVLLVAVLVIWRVTGAGEPTPSTPATGSDVGPSLSLVSTNPDELKQIEIENEQGTYVFEPVTVTSDSGSKRTHYIVASPETKHQDEERVSSLARALLSVTASRVAVERAEDLATYGLATPAATLRYRFNEGEDVEILVGNALPSDERQVYAKLASSDTIYSVNSLGERTALGPTDFVSLKLQPFGLLEVSELRFERRGDPAPFAAHVRTAEELGVTPTPTPDPAVTDATTADPAQLAAMQSWQIDKPVSWEAQSEDVNKLVAEVAQLTAQSCEALEIDDPATYGLDAPIYSFSIGQANHLVTIAIGDEKSQGLRYVSLSDRPGLYTLDMKALTMLERPFLRFFNSFAMIHNITDMGEVIFTTPEKSYTFDIFHPTPDEKKADETLKNDYKLNGEDANVEDSSDKSYFRQLYQGLIGIFINGTDYDAEPTGEVEFTLRMTSRAESPTSYELSLIPRDETTLYIMRDGVYSGFYTLRTNIDNETTNIDKLGILQRIERLETAMREQQNGIYDFPVPTP